jgi:pimeloyl-ACP methyl ester carboxylesterase
MTSSRPVRRFRRSPREFIGGALTLAVILVGTASASTDPDRHPQSARHPHFARPTVVLVHGAWADSSSWSGVVRRLQRDKYAERVLATSLRSLSADTAA